MYDDNEKWHLDIGDLEHLLEGKFRPGITRVLCR
jgi:pantoate--beta-alanine ligase